MLWRPAEHVELTDRRWEQRTVEDAIERIVLDAQTAVVGGYWPGHPLDDVTAEDRLASLYLGSAGVVWGLWKLGASFDAAATVDAAIEGYRAEPDFESEAHPPSLWMGETGLLVVAGLVGSRMADRERLRALVIQNREHPTWELMWGSPGTMLAARACGLDREWEQSARLLWDRWDPAADTWTQDLYGQRTQYLGPAHGCAGNVHVLRGYREEATLASRTARLFAATALHEGGLVNWPPLPDAPPSTIRVQWCHGAPGIICTVGDLVPPELSLGGGELIWRAGPLAKGPGLCHGTAGNGFALLKLYELTQDERWLDRARQFGMHAIEQVERQRTESGRGRYTLWTGDIGVALYLRACLDVRAAFPTIDGF